MPVKTELKPISLPNKNNCPEGWISFFISCYKFHNEEVSYPEAQASYDSYSTKNAKVTIASITNEYENKFHQSFFGSDQTGR